MVRFVIAVFVLITCGWLLLTGADPSPADLVLEQYYAIHSKLASDTTAGVAAAAGQIVTLSHKLPAPDSNSKALLEELRTTAARLQTKTDLKGARAEFAQLSKRMTRYLQTSLPGQRKANQYYCPMAKEGWLQPDRNVRNPYYGASMLKCGELMN
jgi:hypothetical protein